MSGIENVNVDSLIICHSRGKYYNMTDNLNQQIVIKKIECHIPFGIEKFNDKMILNIELCSSNENNNILSKIQSIENSATKKFQNLGLNSVVKKSKLGFIIRTHYLKNTDCFILKKNNEKMMIDEVNLNLSDCEADLTIKGIWTSDNYYGLYIIVNSIKVIKFN